MVSGLRLSRIIDSMRTKCRRWESIRPAGPAPTIPTWVRIGAFLTYQSIIVSVELEEMATNLDPWPELPLAAWKDTYDTLHMWTQIVGKIRMTLTPLINHYWNATLYVSARGLTTSAIPYPRGIFEMEFDFIAHKLVIETSQGEVRTLDLAPRSVADFYAELMSTLAALKIDVQIHATPDEVANPI